MADLKTTLSDLREIDFSALDYDTLQTELIDYIRSAQSNAGIVDDFLDGDAAKVMIDLLSYLGDILAFRMDTLANETYLSTAQRRQSIINILERVAQKPLNPTAATVTLVAIPSTVSQSPITIPARHQISTTGTDGEATTFEVMNDPTDYYTNVDIPAGVTNYEVQAFSGRYVSHNVTATGESALEVVLPEFPVVEGSIKVSNTPVGVAALTPEIINSTRATEIESLAGAADEVVYTVRFNESGQAIITFATENFGIIPAKGSTLHFDYRVGGGANTNVSIGAIESSATFTNTAGDLINVTLANTTVPATGGQDAEDLETVKILSPTRVRANENLVSATDYESIIRDIAGVQDVLAIDAYTDTVIHNGAFSVPDNGIFLWVLPETGGEVSPDLRQQIATVLQDGRLTAIENFVFNPLYNDWIIEGTVTVVGTKDINDVRPLVTTALINAFGRTTATFSNEARLSKIYQAIQSVDGVDHVNITTPATDLTATDNTVLRLLETNISLQYTQ